MTWKDNLIKWDESPKGHYEVWFIIFNNPLSTDGFWIRYTLMSPKDFTSPPTGALWFSYFNSNDPKNNVAKKLTYPREKINFSRDKFFIEIGSGKLNIDGAIGEIKTDDHVINWDLKFTDHEKKTHQHLPALIRKLKIASTTYCSPNLAFKLNGTITINDHKIELKNAPATQAHIFGKKYGSGWAWCHCNYFEEDRDAIIELLSSRLKPGGRLLSAFYIKTERNEFKLNSVLNFFKNKSEYDINCWNFESKQGNYKIKGKITVDEKDLIGVEYLGPLGRHLHCYNSELASCEVQILKKVKKRWETVDTLTSNRTTAFETSHSKEIERLEIKIPW